MGYSKAYELARKHYENFPVVSLFIPARLRKHIAIVYWFSRTADDYADEGQIDALERMANLISFENHLKHLLVYEPNNNYEAALKNTIISRNLNHDNFFNLINAFKQDVTKSRYENFNEVLVYCSLSANPVGRIILELLNIRSDRAFHFSDKICTALQLTNFVQDTVIDYEKGRIYYPMDEMVKFGATEDMFEMKKNNLNLKMLIEFSVNRVQSLFDEGRGLLEFLSGRFKYEINWTIKCGEAILNKIRGNDFDVLTKRPVLTKADHLKIILTIFFKV